MREKKGYAKNSDFMGNNQWVTLIFLSNLLSSSFLCCWCVTVGWLWKERELRKCYCCELSERFLIWQLQLINLQKKKSFLKNMGTFNHQMSILFLIIKQILSSPHHQLVFELLLDNGWRLITTKLDLSFICYRYISVSFI